MRIGLRMQVSPSTHVQPRHETASRDALDEMSVLMCLQRVSSEASIEARLRELLLFLRESTAFEFGLLVVESDTEYGTRWVMKEGQADHAPQAEQWLRAWDAGHRDAARSDCSEIPLMQRGELCGALFTVPALSEAEAERVAGWLQAVMCLLRPVERNHNLDDRGKRMAVLNKLNTILASTLKYDDILAFVHDGVQQLIGADVTRLMLLDDADPTLLFRYDKSGVVTTVPLDSSHPGLKQCLDTRRAIRLGVGTGGAGGAGYLCVPLVAGGRLLGAIEVEQEDEESLRARDEDYLVTFAASAANAIANARHFHELKVANADLEATHWEVLRSHDVLQTVFDAITAEMYIIDSDYSLMSLNAASAARIEERPQALLGKRCYSELAGRSQPCPGCRAVEAIYRSMKMEWEQRRWEDDREPIVLEMTAYPLTTPGKRAPQSLVFARDVTEKRRMEAVLGQAEKMAAVGRLATGVAHEISNPLTAMIGNAELLRRSASNAEQMEALEMIVEAGERTRKVIQNLLDLAGDDHVDLTPLAVNQTIRTAVMRFQGDSRFELVMDLEENLPKVPGNLEQMEDLWRHLILNAGDALETRKAIILIQSEQATGGIAVRVSEYGRAIPSEELASLFEPYASLSMTTRGQGVGLTICRRIVKLHGGDIRVASKPGEATTFHVWLPAASEQRV